MKSKAKVFAFSLVLTILAIMMAACGGNSDSSSTVASASRTVTVGEQIEKLVVDNVNQSRGEEYVVLTNDLGMRKKSLDALGYIQNNGLIAAKYATQVNVTVNSATGVTTVELVVVITDEALNENLENVDEDAMLTPTEITMDNAEQIATEIWKVTDEDEQDLIDAIAQLCVYPRERGEPTASGDFLCGSPSSSLLRKATSPKGRAVAAGD